ncbi:TPA: CPBP family intramembrane metalloprotease [Staphylococcus aureus]|nr:CPBP family intramembrane metalloprotease [Staphylococcus aureus]HDG4884469.1 CPBP family intramembrane metalloprotease [Staphylococcus aureus]HDK3864941.1 CPBP family intramembrane metalloprotease [Staphylococcus aureus]HEO8862713.1 CPBP family intramembrane metalloprotease [Staphylococcus aureus]
MKKVAIPNKNRIKKLKTTDKLVFILVACGFSTFLEDVFSLITKITSDGVSKNQQKNNMDLENNPLWYTLFDSSVNASIIEEIMFRGIFYLIIFSIFERMTKRALPYIIFVLVSSIYFGYRHVSIAGDYQYIYSYVASGIVLSIVFLVTKNIFYSAAVHGIGNCLVILNNAQYKGVSDISANVASYIVGGMILFVLVHIVVRVVKNREEIENKLDQVSNKLLSNIKWLN